MSCPFCKFYYFSSSPEVLKIKAEVELKGTGAIATLTPSGCPSPWLLTTRPGPGSALGSSARREAARFPIARMSSLQSFRIPPVPFAPGWRWSSICACQHPYVAIHHKELMHKTTLAIRIWGCYQQDRTLGLLNDRWLPFDVALRLHTRKKM